MDGIARGRRVQVFFGEADQINHRPRYDLLLQYLRREGAAGATVMSGVAGFGLNSTIKSATVLRFSVDLPMILTWVDAPERVDRLLPGLRELAGSGIITVEDVGIASYGTRRLEQLRFDLLVGDVMVRPVVSVKQSDHVKSAVRRLIDRSFRALPVVDDTGRLVGILSNTDLIERAGLSARLELLSAMSFAERERIIATIPAELVASAMHPGPVSLRETQTLEQATRLMSEQRIKRVPVVDGAGTLVGILSRADVLRAVAESFPHDAVAGHPDPGATTVGELMRTDGPVVRDSATLDSVIAAVASTRLNRAVVVDAERKVVGLVTDADVLGAADPSARLRVVGALMRADGLPGGRVTAADIMRRTIPTIGEDATIAEAARLMMEHHQKILPVVDPEGRLVGVIDRADLLHAASGALEALSATTFEDEEE